MDGLYSLRTLIFSFVTESITILIYEDSYTIPLIVTVHSYDNKFILSQKGKERERSPVNPLFDFSIVPNSHRV